MRILVIEDEPRMLESLRKGLYEHDYAVMTAMNGDTGLEIANQFDFDAIVLDIGLPGRNGFQVTRELRQGARATPILMLTARDSEDDIIRGLDIGADDYMTKPFSFPELVARLQSITRTKREETTDRIRIGDLVVDFLRHCAIRDNVNLELSRSEFLLLSCLVRQAGQCVSRQTLLKSVWGDRYQVGRGALDVLMNSLRTKVDGSHQNKLISTLRGRGYIFSSLSAESQETLK